MSKNRITVRRVDEAMSFLIDNRTTRVNIIHVAEGHCGSCGEVHGACAPRENQAHLLVRDSIANCGGIPTQHENAQSLSLSATA